MISFLRKQENCRINGKGFVVLNLYNFLDLMEKNISYHEVESRRKNLACLTMKGTLKRVYEAYKLGDIEQPDVIKKSKFSIYST